jgi:RimJ/RimL family protein N-acetyltransferase
MQGACSNSYRPIGHLTAHGDYEVQVAADVEAIEAELAGDLDRNWRFGIFLKSDLIGRIDLVGVDPPRYSLGYWLDSVETEKGFATEAARTLIGFARDNLRATELFAGVTHGNARSVALLARLGFKPVANFETYTRFHLGLH